MSAKFQSHARGGQTALRANRPVPMTSLTADIRTDYRLYRNRSPNTDRRYRLPVIGSSSTNDVRTRSVFSGVVCRRQIGPVGRSQCACAGARMLCRASRSKRRSHKQQHSGVAEYGAPYLTTCGKLLSKREYKPSGD